MTEAPAQDARYAEWFKLLKTILWVSNGGRTPTGYGVQTGLFTRLLKQFGFNPVVFAYYGCEGAPFRDSDGILNLPRIIDPYGSDVIRAHFENQQAQIILTLLDAWVLNHDIYRQLPWCAMTPIDTEPVLPGNVAILQQAARWVMAISHFGQEALIRAGVDPHKIMYVPHGVDLGIFKPEAQDAARKRLAEASSDLQFGDKFMVCMMAANKGRPSRKGFYEAFKAFKLFADTHPDSILYCHTEVQGVWQGENMAQLMKLVGLRDEQVIFPSQYHFLVGYLGPEFLATVYNAADVMLMTSHAEGFCVPVIEAQACGLPVIASDNSALSELTKTGWQLPCVPWMPADGILWQRPSIDAAVAALEGAYQERGTLAEVDRSARALAFAQDYGHVKVFEDYFLPALRHIEADLSIPVKHTAPRLSNRKGHEHQWSPLGWIENGVIYNPCHKGACEAARRQQQTGAVDIVEHFFKQEVNGVKLKLRDNPRGGVAKVVLHEINTAYRLNEIEFTDGDIVIDIGAHVGVVSCYLGKRYPFIEVYAYEPSPDNYKHLRHNIKANGLTNVHAMNQAVTGDGRQFFMSGHPEENSGGITGFSANGKGAATYSAPSVTLAEIMKPFARVKLLKIDCEGAEYEVLQGQNALLKRVDHLRGEFHINPLLESKGYRMEALAQLVKDCVPDSVIQLCRMGD